MKSLKCFLLFFSFSVAFEVKITEWCDFTISNYETFLTCVDKIKSMNEDGVVANNSIIILTEFRDTIIVDSLRAVKDLKGLEVERHFKNKCYLEQMDRRDKFNDIVLPPIILVECDGVAYQFEFDSLDILNNLSIMVD